MANRRALAEHLSPGDRRRILACLAYGPWRLTRFAGGPPVGEPMFPDDELRAAWEEWAFLEAPSRLRPEWGDETWAHWRFTVGLEPVEAFEAARECRAR